MLLKIRTELPSEKWRVSFGEMAATEAIEARMRGSAAAAVTFIADQEMLTVELEVRVER